MNVQQLSNVDFNAIWQAEMGWLNPDKSGRKFNDTVEAEFWQKLAPQYTQKYNLNDDTDLIADRLETLLGKGNTILEIGCGSGNFTVLMAKYAKHILGLDFSAAMVHELQKRLKTDNCGKNITTQIGKWEDFTVADNLSFDYVVSVNSLYRIYDIKSALLKMWQYADKGVVLVRTIQRPFFAALYDELQLTHAECLDYQLMPMVFWQNKLTADVEFLHYEKQRQFKDIDAVIHEMELELGEDVFLTHKKELLEKFCLKAIWQNGVYMIKQPRTTVIISVKK